MSIQLEVGKSYKSLEGSVYKIVSKGTGVCPFTDGKHTWQPNGRFSSSTIPGDPYHLDLVEEINDGKPDSVNHPPHYTSHPSGIECIQVTEHMGFNLGNAIKYIWRADLKADAIEDMRKAVWCIEREIAKRGGK